MARCSCSVAYILPTICKSQNKMEEIDTARMTQSQIYIETDPTALFFNGFSLVIRRSATINKHAIIGIGIYKVDLPDFYIEALESNAGKDWKAGNLGIDLFADYFFFDPNKGLSLGVILSLYNYNISRLGEKESYQSFVETLRMGYLWRPIKKFESLYLYPWVGISTGQNLSGSNEIAGESFTLKKWNFVPAFQFGYSF